MTNNILLKTDSYKFSHAGLYPDNVEYVSSYIESRGGNYEKSVFVGPQYFLNEVLSKPFTYENVIEYDEVCRLHGFVPRTKDWLNILQDYDGYLPLRIQAVKEGTVMPVKNVLVQVTNTDKRFPWLTSYIETSLLRAVWYPTTVASRSYAIKQKIKAALEKTSDNVAAVLPFRLHDFGARGVSSGESAGIGGFAHLVNFMGTDTVEALMVARKYYGEHMAGYSIPATEHSISTSFGPGKGEYDYIDRVLTNLENAPDGSMHAIVGDTYDIYNFVLLLGDKFLERIKALALRNKVLVVRPDSGDPLVVPVDVVKGLASAFGFTVNTKGFKVLYPSVRVIQGDGINDESIDGIIKNMIDAEFSLENIAFGMGGRLLQGLNRDTMAFAMKASAIKHTNDYDWIGIQKTPKTDPKKASKKGRLGLILEDGTYKTVPEIEANGKNLLEDIYLNGKITRYQTLAEMRSLAA